MFPRLYFLIPSYLQEIERYIYHQSFLRGFPLSSKILLISDSASCLIFKTSRWPFQRTNKVLKMQVLSSCERQLGHSPLLFPKTHRGVCATNKLQSRWSDTRRPDMFSCQLTFCTCSARVPVHGHVFLHSRFGHLIFIVLFWVVVGVRKS